MNRMEVSKQRKTTPFRHAFIKDLVEMDSEWAVHCTYEEIIQASDIIKKSAAGQALTTATPGGTLPMTWHPSRGSQRVLTS